MLRVYSTSIQKHAHVCMDMRMHGMRIKSDSCSIVNGLKFLKRGKELSSDILTYKLKNIFQ